MKVIEVAEKLELPIDTINKKVSLAGMLGNEDIKKRFTSLLGSKAPGFISSILSAVNGNAELKKAEPNSVISAAAIAASLDLPINSNLGFAHIVPYKKDGIPIAQFQMGWKGFIQLAQRTGQYKTINAAIVYEGEIQEINRFTGEILLSADGKISDTIVGYVAYFKLLNGFEKYYYMSKEEVEKHGNKYSKSFKSEYGRWKLDFDSMALKTVIKMLLSKYGILSIGMETAIQADQAIIRDDESYEYADTDNPVESGTKKKTEALKDKLKNPKEIKLEQSPTALTEFETKYFDLCTAISDAEGKEILDSLMVNIGKQNIESKDYIKLTELIEKRRKELKL